jgi:uncharacterized protein YcbX
MLVDTNNRFISQREHSILATLATEFVDGGLSISAQGRLSLFVPFNDSDREPEPVRIWQDSCDAIEVSAEASEWFSTVLGVTCRLVHMPDNSRRPVASKFSLTANHIVSFADAYPLLLLTEGSLAELNGRLPSPLPMNRFRPNLVIADAAPFAEDTWKTVSVGECLFRVAKPCARCVVPTIDQDLGIRIGDEPLKTLATFRRQNDKILFGQNLIAQQKGIVRLGDEVKAVALPERMRGEFAD